MSRTSKHSVHTHVLIDAGGEQHEIEAEATFNLTPGCSDWWCKSVGAWMPGDPSETELLSLRLKVGSDWIAAPEWLFGLLYSDTEFLARLGDKLDMQEAA